MVGWHHRLYGYESEQDPGDREGQGRLVCCSPWGSQSQTRMSDWKTAMKSSIFSDFSLRFQVCLRVLEPITNQTIGPFR